MSDTFELRSYQQECIDTINSRELNDLGVISGDLNKYQASVLIARKFASR